MAQRATRYRFNKFPGIFPKILLDLSVGTAYFLQILPALNLYTTYQVKYAVNPHLNPIHQEKHFNNIYHYGCILILST